jgi:2-phospho-L-lactate guanylyltransferase
MTPSTAAVDRLWLVVVARVGPRAKSRLAPLLAPAGRRQLALAMLADVLAQCRVAPAVSGLVAVVDDPTAGALAAAAGARLVDDPGAGDMNAAVRAGIADALTQQATTVIVLPGDIPLLTPTDLAALQRAAGTAVRAVVVAASRDGRGTNALLLRPPTVIAPGFGPPSVARHLRAGAAAGARTTTLDALGVAHDVDTPADLAELPPAAVGPCTAAALAELTDGPLLRHVR